MVRPLIAWLDGGSARSSSASSSSSTPPSPMACRSSIGTHCRRQVAIQPHSDPQVETSTTHSSAAYRASSSMICPCRRRMLPRQEPRPATHGPPAQPPASSWTRQPTAFPAGKCSKPADTRHDVPDADSDRARLPDTGPAPRLGASGDVPDEGLTREAGPGPRRYGMTYQETGSGDERDI
jgi:hypothetical protein